MSKKSLAILLLLPFIISILFFVTSSFLFTKIQGDITNISWKYKNEEAFSLNDKIKLEATPILANEEEDVNATLIWSVKNVDESQENHAEIQIIDGESYLVPLSEGVVIVTCKNTSGNIFKSFKAKLFSGFTLVVNTSRARSSQKIDSNDYYGMYDFVNDQIVKASFFLDVQVVSEESNTENVNYNVVTSSNITYDKTLNKVTINSFGDSYVNFVSISDSNNILASYKFITVEEGYNVYSYNDLLKCTNEDEKGKIVCLQTNLDSLKNTYELDEKGNIKVDENKKPILKEETTALFGNYDMKNKKFSFKEEIYSFESTYNTEFIDQYNKTVAKDEQVSKQVLAGVHIQKDFYGNGYLINAHNLCYPSGTTIGDTGLVNLASTDLFRGPLPYVFIGNPSSPIVKAYGQDNVGFYVDGDNITLNDVFFKNCDFSSILQNDDTTGTVVEVNGDNVVIKNSYLSSGRTVLRAFSTNNLLVKNSLLEKGREFIAKIGSNEYEKIDLNQKVSFTIFDEQKEMTKEQFIKEYLDGICLELLMKGIKEAEIPEKELMSLSKVVTEVLNPREVIENENGEIIYKGDVTFEDTYFYQSGIFSLGIDAMFNGSYLYSGSPLKAILGDMIEGVLFPDNIGGVSYPTKTILKGDTRFYDYKTIEEIDINCLVYQDVSSLTGGNPLDLDSFFPIKSLLFEEAKKGSYVHNSENKLYVSTMLAKYGGGINRSTVLYDELDSKNEIVNDVRLDILNAAVNNAPATSEINDLLAFMIGRCVPMATGFEPFEVMMYNGRINEEAYLFNEQISLDNLISRQD